MKKLRHNPSYNKLYLLFIFIALTAIIIQSCKKDNHTEQQLIITDPVITQAKTWYESTYPLTSGKLNTQATGDNPDLSQIITPDWQRNANYTRYNKKVIEIPIDPSSKYATALRNTSTGKATNKAYSRSSFILLNNGTGYDAYVMTIIADSAYLQGDLTKLDHNKYNKRDKNFSGTVLYFTPKGKFVSGWFYKDGKIVKSPLADNPTTQKVQNVQTSAQKTLHDVCIDWFQDWSGLGGSGTVYLGRTCAKSIDSPLAGPDSNGGGGIFQPSDGGGGSGDGTPGDPPKDPCDQSINTRPIQVNSFDNDPVNDGDGDGGFPPPTNQPTTNPPTTNPPPTSPPPTNPCTVVPVVLPPEGFRPLCKGSIKLTAASSNTSDVNMEGIQFGIVDLPHFPLYKTNVNVISFNLYINIPNQIADPTNQNKFVSITPEMQKEFIYQAYHFASEQINLVHGQDFFAAGAQPKYSTMFAAYVAAYLNTIALQGRFPAYENANPGLIPSLGARTSTLITPSKASSAVYTNLPSGEGC